MTLAPCVDLPAVARAAAGFSGADLKAVLYTALQLQQKRIQQGRSGSEQGRSALDPAPGDGSVETFRSTLLTQESLLEAVRETQPSVSDLQLQKFNAA